MTEKVLNAQHLIRVAGFGELHETILAAWHIAMGQQFASQNILFHRRIQHRLNPSIHGRRVDASNGNEAGS